MGQCKKDVTPLLTQWSYVFLALTHRYKAQAEGIVCHLLESYCASLSASASSFMEELVMRFVRCRGYGLADGDDSRDLQLLPLIESESLPPWPQPFNKRDFSGMEIK